MKKKALSLVEVLISVMLISVVIVAMLQMKENNLYFLEKTKDSIQSNAYISMLALDESIKFRNENVYLDKKFDFKDDDIRKELKNVKIKLEDEELKPLEFTSNDYLLKINIKQTSLNIDEKKKIFYRFSLEN